MRVRFWASVVAAVGLFAAAGVITWQNWDSMPGVQAAGPAGVKGTQGSGRRAPVRVPAGAPASGPAAEAAGPNASRSLLARELFAQALLMALRDAGRPAHDPVLEPAAVGSADAAGGGRRWGVEVTLIDHEGVDVRLVSPAGDRPWATLIPYKGNWLDYLDLAEKAEGFRREAFRRAIAARAEPARGEPAATAPAAGPQSSAAADEPTAVAALAAEQERRLGDMSLFSQFEAVRAAHQAVAERGETPEAVGWLVRGYANLAQLTQFLWSAAPKAFEARALLWAERMVRQWPAEPNPLWHRAYAAAMAGLHARALEALDEADRTTARAGKAAEPPAWAGPLRHACRYDTRALADATAVLTEADSPTAGLAAYLAFLTLEGADSPSMVNAAGESVLSRAPDCLRALDRMIEVSGVSANHRLTVTGLPALAAALADRLPAMPGVPADAAAAARAVGRNRRDLAQWKAVSAALAAAPAGDAAADALSWPALARTLREAQFVLVQRRAAFLAQSLGVDASDETGWLRPLYADHPYRGMIDVYAARHPGPAEKRAALADTIVGDPVGPMQLMFIALHEAGLRPAGKELGAGRSYSQWAGRHMDVTANDTERYLRRWGSDRGYMMYLVRELGRASPHNPLYKAKLIEYDWAAAEPQVPGWPADHPLVAGALGKRYVELRRWADAEAAMRRYVANVPDARAYERLALAQLRQGNEAGWLRTLREALGQPDFGLDHARINANVAHEFIARRRFAEAKPYADRAAESWASFGLLVAAQCEEGLGNWAAAERWVRRNADRYDVGGAWFQWCVRTGKGNAAAAEREAAAALNAPRPDAAGREALVDRGSHQLLKSDPAAAEPVFRESFATYNDTWAAMQAAVIRDAAGDRAGCEQALRALVAAAEKNEHAPGRPRAGTEWTRPRIAALATVFLAADPAGRLDRRAVDEVIAAPTTRRERINLNYFAGRMSELRGDREAALHYLRRAAAAPDPDSTNRALAWVHLRRLGVDPTEVYKTPWAEDEMSEVE